MNKKKYFDKNGFVYGVSSKYVLGWVHDVYKFNDYKKAEKWLHTEQYDFRERELCSRSRAINLAGVAAVENADYREDIL